MSDAPHDPNQDRTPEDDELTLDAFPSSQVDDGAMDRLESGLHAAEDAERVETGDEAEWAEAVADIDRSIEEIQRATPERSSSGPVGDAEYQAEAATQGLDYQPQSILPPLQPAASAGGGRSGPRDLRSAGIAPTVRCRIEERVGGELARIWRHLFNPADGGSPEAVVITGVTTGDGSTHLAVALGLAGAKASREHRVAIVDFNLRSPGVASLIGVSPRAGLSDVLTRGVPVNAVIHPVCTENDAVLFFLPAGSAAEDPRSLIKADKTRALLADLRSRFDYLIIDVAPADAYPDAAVLGALADGALLVSRSDDPQGRARFARERLDLAGVRNLGLVLNQSSANRRRWN